MCAQDPGTVPGLDAAFTQPMTQASRIPRVARFSKLLLRASEHAPQIPDAIMKAAGISLDSSSRGWAQLICTVHAPLQVTRCVVKMASPACANDSGSIGSAQAVCP